MDRPIAQTRRFARSGLAYARVIAYLVGFGVLVAFVVHYYLIPALQAAGQATGPERSVLAAQSRLVLALVLFVLLMGLFLVFRIGRFFFPRRRQPPESTTYTDAWAESARRLRLDEQEE